MNKTIVYILLLLCMALAHSAHAQRDTLANKQRGGAIKINNDTLRVPIVNVDSLAQNDTLPKLADTTQLMPGKSNPVVRFFKKDYPNPRKALWMSLALPGAGQAYNRKWWKIPIVYAALGTVGYIEYNNIVQYRRYKTNYKALVDGDPNTLVTDPLLQLQDATTMKANREVARKNLETSSLILGLTYILSVTDAFVDAHMYTFDVSDDLSLKFCPETRSIPGFGSTFGVGVALQF